MNAKLEKFFNDYEAKEKKRQVALLVELKLTEKVYSPTNTYSEEYCYNEGEGKATKYFKIAPIEVTPEEYARILKYASVTRGSNKVASLMNGLAWFVYIAGAIGGIIIGVEMSSFYITLACWVSVFVLGSTFLGFAEALKLLCSIDSKG